jgi:malate dehydrogenase (oxaloacetate-decarboxylating)
LVATGTEFPPISFNGKTVKIAQCNNFYIFPAIGLAVTASGAKRVTDSMMVAAASTLGSLSQDMYDTDGSLLPPIEKMRDVAIHIAVRVGLQAQKDRVASEMSEQELNKLVQKRFWIPEYRNYKFVRKTV